MKDLELTLQLRNNQIKERRLNEKLTQKQLGEAIGVARATMGAIVW